MVLSTQVDGYLAKASWIRRMFEAGIELKKQYGDENVYDFSLGNPDLAPPQAVAQGLRDLAEEAGQPFAFGYMPNAGYPVVREQLAGAAGLEAACPAQGAVALGGNTLMASGTLRSLGVRVRGREVSAVYTFEGY